MNMDEALKYIHGVSWLGTIPGLEREQELLSRIGNPHKGMKYIHVAGTNGKGSTAAMLASILRKAGYRVESLACIESMSDSDIKFCQL